MLIVMAMIFCTLLIIGALGGKAKLLNALGAIFTILFLAVIAVAVLGSH